MPKYKRVSLFYKGPLTAITVVREWLKTIGCGYCYKCRKVFAIGNMVRTNASSSQINACNWCVKSALDQIKDRSIQFEAAPSHPDLLLALVTHLQFQRQYSQLLKQHGTLIIHHVPSPNKRHKILVFVRKPSTPAAPAAAAAPDTATTTTTTTTEGST